MSDKSDPTTLPYLDGAGPNAASVVIDPYVRDTLTNAFYVHRDYVAVCKDWEVQEHTPPPCGTYAFGDVASWVEYVTRYGEMERDAVLITWSLSGLHAVLDHHVPGAGNGGREQWCATMPFARSTELVAWEELARKSAVTQAQAVERIEDLMADIVEPSGADILHLLRSLRANSRSTAETEIRPDGTTAVSWSQERALVSKAGEGTFLPGSLQIAIPILRGDPVRTAMQVRVRAAVNDEAHLQLRFGLVNLERTFEAVCLERANEAQAALGTAFRLLRAAD